MAKENKEEKKINEEKNSGKSEKPNKGEKKEEKDFVRLIRISGKDILGNKKILAGLTKIKGVSWSFSNALCKKMKIDNSKTIQDLSPEEIKMIEDFISSPDLPLFLKNRRKDIDSGEDVHLTGSDLDLRKDFDIKRLRKIKSYRGVRHAAGLPVRGQRTKSNFRKNKKKSGSVGVRKKK